ncbi:retrovirus-related Pol polyprotein from transposon TNT 1-94 [Trichonephila clavipes]|nr:retrovirus-related Pol polyprotein from transposon TNT 1-94 [Trichonephila clavipes]
MNGVAERYNLTALDGIKTLLNESGISQKFWSEVFLTPGTGFGCLAFVGVPKQLRRKLDLRAKLGIMLGYALSTKGYRIWLIEENKVVETINDFPEDGDIFSAVSDRTDYPEADSERDTRPSGADSENGSNVRLRSFNEVQKYCKDKNIDFDQNLFNFSSKNSSSGKVTDLLNLPLEEKANLAEVRIPKTYREATRTAEAAVWEGTMDKEMQVMYDRKVWNLVEPPKETKVLGCRWVYSLKRNEQIQILDVNNVYLYARLDKVIYMQQPDGYVNEANKGLVLSKLDCPSTPAEINEMAKYPYRNLIGSLSFIAARTRPDKMYTVNLLSQFQSNPGIKHWNSLLKLLAFGFVEVRLDDGVTFPAGWCVNHVWVPWNRFVEWAQNEIAVVPDFHKRILFSDEAHFWLNGYVNKQNCRIWSEANPQVYVETPLHPEKLTVWCALWAGGIIGPYFFKNDEGHNVTVNGDRYRAMVTNFFLPELNNHDVQELGFQQDGATCHTARATIDLLKDTFGDRLISHFGPVNGLQDLAI